jgi:TetR/AcrR family tetracycline transcriptional repressor
LRGLEALLGSLSRLGIPAAVGVHAVYAVLTYTTGFVAWELPLTRRQSPTTYAASWRREFASLPPADFPPAVMSENHAATRHRRLPCYGGRP